VNSIVTHPATPPRAAARRRSLAIGAATVAIAVAAVLFAVLKGGTSGSSEVSSLPYVAAVAVLAGLFIFGWLVPARIAAGGTGLPLAIIAIPFLAAFWSALSLVLAAGAIVIAAAHRSGDGARPGRALAAIIIGALVAVATLGAVLAG
jgi:hypothetical protein